MTLYFLSVRNGRHSEGNLEDPSTTSPYLSPFVPIHSAFPPVTMNDSNMLLLKACFPSTDSLLSHQLKVFFSSNCLPSPPSPSLASLLFPFQDPLNQTIHVSLLLSWKHVHTCAPPQKNPSWPTSHSTYCSIFKLSFSSRIPWVWWFSYFSISYYSHCKISRHLYLFCSCCIPSA